MYSFSTSDAAFDIHWVDAAGQELPIETAMKGVKSAKIPQPEKQ
jgi:hypothetical protein